MDTFEQRGLIPFAIDSHHNYTTDKYWWSYSCRMLLNRRTFAQLLRRLTLQVMKYTYLNREYST